MSESGQRETSFRLHPLTRSPVSLSKPPPPPPPLPKHRFGKKIEPISAKGKSKLPPPTAQDFTESAVNRAVLSETLQHPLTILPVAASAVGALYLGVVAANPVGLLATIGAGVLGAGAWIVNYFLRGQKLVDRHLEALRKRRREASLEEIEEIEHGWAEVRHTEGVKQARELREAYVKLLGYLREKTADASSLSSQRLQVLAEDTYHEGVTVLRTALQIHRAVKTFDSGSLAEELQEYRDRVAELEEDDARREGFEVRIEGLMRRLELFHKRRDSVDRLLAESELLEAALESTYLEVVELDAPETLLARGDSLTELEKSVAAARRVEERLQAQLSGGSPDDEEYLRAGA